MRKKEAIDALMVTAYKALLDAAFLWCVLPLFGYQIQFHGSNQPNYSKLLPSYAIVWFSIWFFWRIKESAIISRFLIFMQIVMILIPFMTLYWILDLPNWHVGMMMLGFLSLITTATFAHPIKLRPPRKSVRTVLVVLMILILTYVYIGLIATGGLGRLNFNLRDVYGVRADYVENRLPGFGYFVTWTAYIFNMALFVTFLKKRDKQRLTSYIGVIIVLGLQLLIFGMTNYKAFLFVPFTVLGLIFLAKRMPIQRAVLIGVPVVIASMLILNVLGIEFGAALLGRLFFTPAALHSLYFSYFSVHPYALLGDTFGPIFGAPYSQSVIQIIAEEYWGRIFSPNVGWIADSYANLGPAGVITYGFMLGILLKIGDGLVGSHVEPGVVEGLMVGPVFALCSSAIGTVLLTHGFLIVLIVLWALKGYWTEEIARMPTTT